jgi:hypothetical protein
MRHIGPIIPFVSYVCSFVYPKLYRLSILTVTDVKPQTLKGVVKFHCRVVLPLPPRALALSTSPILVCTSTHACPSSLPLPFILLLLQKHAKKRSKRRAKKRRTAEKHKKKAHEKQTKKQTKRREQLQELLAAQNLQIRREEKKLERLKEAYVEITGEEYEVVEKCVADGEVHCGCNNCSRRPLFDLAHTKPNGQWKMLPEHQEVIILGEDGSLDRHGIIKKQLVLPVLVEIGDAPDAPVIPTGLSKMHKLGLENVIVEVDLSEPGFDYDEFGPKKLVDMVVRLLHWAKANMGGEDGKGKQKKVFVNIRDLPGRAPLALERIFNTVHCVLTHRLSRPPSVAMDTSPCRVMAFTHLLGKLPLDIRPIGLLFEEPMVGEHS